MISANSSLKARIPFAIFFKQGYLTCLTYNLTLYVRELEAAHSIFEQLLIWKIYRFIDSSSCDIPALLQVVPNKTEIPCISAPEMCEDTNNVFLQMLPVPATFLHIS